MLVCDIMVIKGLLPPTTYGAGKQIKGLLPSANLFGDLSEKAQQNLAMQGRYMAENLFKSRSHRDFEEEATFFKYATKEGMPFTVQEIEKIMVQKNIGCKVCVIKDELYGRKFYYLISAEPMFSMKKL